MTINLNKVNDKKINLTKQKDKIENIKVLLWWKAPLVTPAYDLDLSCFVLGNTPIGPKLLSEDWFIFFNNESSPNGAIVKSPDARDNEGQEEIVIKIKDLPLNADELSLIVTIHKGDKRGQTFGQVPEAGLKIINLDTNEEIAFYDLDADFKTETAVQIGSFYKVGNEFSFQAIGTGYNLSINDFVIGYIADDMEVIG